MVTYYSLMIAKNTTQPEGLEFLSEFCDLTLEELHTLLDFVLGHGIEMYDIIITSGNYEE